jgi:hypothetical protein
MWIPAFAGMTMIEYPIENLGRALKSWRAPQQTRYFRPSHTEGVDQ